MLDSDGWEHAVGYHWLLGHALNGEIAVGMPGVVEGLDVFAATPTAAISLGVPRMHPSLRPYPLLVAAHLCDEQREEILERGGE